MENKGQIKVIEATITIYEGSINKYKDQTEFAGLSTEQSIGAVGAHESEHAVNEEVIIGTYNNQKNNTNNYDIENIPNKAHRQVINELKSK